MNNYDYPMGADTSSAPWNQEENPRLKILRPESFEVSVDFGWLRLP